MAHAQNSYLVFQRNGRVHLNRRGSQFSRILAVEECGSAGRPWIYHVPRYSARVVATLYNRLFPLHFPSHASPCVITFRTACTYQPVSRNVSVQIALGHISAILSLCTLFSVFRFRMQCSVFNRYKSLVKFVS